MTTALVVIDVQQAMFAMPGFRLHDGEAVVDRIADLIARAREKRVPIFFVQHDGGPDDPFHPGKPGFPFHAKLTPRADDNVTVKTKCNSFQGTDLQTKLQKAGVDHLIVCGMQTEYCVDTAVRAAVERGYNVTFASDAHTTFDTPALKAVDIIAHHNATFDGSFADIRNAAQITF